VKMNTNLKRLSVACLVALTVSLNTIAQTVQEGLRNLDAERYNAAGKIFNQLATATPTVESYYYLGYYYLNLPEKDLAKAKEAFEKGNALEKKGDPLCRVGLGATKLLSGDKAGAKADFDLIKKDTKNKNSDVLFRIGEAYTLGDKTNDAAEAVSNIEAGLAIQKVKNNPDYYMALSDGYMVKNDGGPAMTALENALRMGQKLAKINTKMAIIWYQGKKYDDAQKLLKSAIEADAEHAPAYEQLANLYTTFGKFKLAAENALKYLEKSDADDKAKLKYVKLAFASKDYEGALKVLNEIKERVQDPIKYRLEGLIKSEMGQHSEAINLLGTFIEKAGKDRLLPLDFMTLGKAKLKANDSTGIAEIEKAESMGDTTENHNKLIGDWLYTGKKYVKAAEYFEKGLVKWKKTTPTDVFDVAKSWWGAKNWAKADDWYGKVCEGYKDTWATPYLSRARARQYANPTDSSFSAAPFYEKYIQILPEADKQKNAKNLAEAYGVLGQKALMLEKNIPKATELLNNVLKYDPANVNAQKLLQVINGGGTPTTTPTTTPPPNNGTGGGTGGTGGAIPKN
jgi:tetratricopeptide (TPR) repeat protein